MATATQKARTTRPATPRATAASEPAAITFPRRAT
jgi:hypothetical protein